MASTKDGSPFDAGRGTRDVVKGANGPDDKGGGTSHTPAGKPSGGAKVPRTGAKGKGD